MIHIGSLIQEEFKKTGISLTALAQKMDKERSTVYDIFRREKIDTDLLYQLSEILKVDFFSAFSKELKKTMKLKDLEATRKVVVMELSDDEFNKLMSPK